MTTLAGSAGFAELRVVTPAAWLARDLASAGTIPVVHDLGLDAPADTSRTAWWAPHRFVARLAVTPGVTRPALTSPGPDWLSTVPSRWLRREVWCGPLARADGAPLWARGAVFAKPAEVKLERFPAAVVRSPAELADRAAAAGLAPTSRVVLSQVVDFAEEHRCFVGPGPDGRPAVLAASAYLLDGVTWDAWETPSQAPPSVRAAAFARKVAAAVPGPPGFVLDVGRLRDGGWAVIEANAAWSSNPYHAAPTGVVASVLAAQRPDAEPGWSWRSDPVIDRFARPLPVRR